MYFFVDRCCPFVIFFGQLCCLSFFDLQILITPLVSLVTIHDENMAEDCSKNYEPMQNIDVTR